MAKRLPQVMTLSETCKYLRVTRQTLYRWIVELSLPVIRMGRTSRFQRSAVDRWLDDRTDTGPRAPAPVEARPPEPRSAPD